MDFVSSRPLLSRSRIWGGIAVRLGYPFRSVILRECGVSSFAGSDSNRFHDFRDKDLAVADFTRLGRRPSKKTSMSASVSMGFVSMGFVSMGFVGIGLRSSLGLAGVGLCDGRTSRCDGRTSRCDGRTSRPGRSFRCQRSLRSTAGDSRGIVPPQRVLPPRKSWPSRPPLARSVHAARGRSGGDGRSAVTGACMRLRLVCVADGDGSPGLWGLARLWGLPSGLADAARVA